MANEYAEAARWIEAANFYKRNIEIFSQRERERGSGRKKCISKSLIMKWLHLELSASHVTKLSRHNYHVLVTESIKDNFINKRDVGSGGDNDDGDGGKSMFHTHTHTHTQEHYARK